MFRSIVRRLNGFPGGAAAINSIRPLYRDVRTAYLRTRYPQGGYLSGTGIRVFCDFRDANYMWYERLSVSLAFETFVLQQLVMQSTGSVFIDVGAHYGYFSVVLAQMVSDRTPHAHLIAIEPDGRNFRCLERTMAAVDGLQKSLLPIAVGDSDSEVTLYRAPKATCLHTYDEPDAEPCGVIPMRCLDSTVAEVLPSQHKVAVMKVDIDGAEPGFLAGASATMAVHKPLVLMEFSPSILRNASHEPQAFFQDLCRKYHVYWVNWNRRAVIPVSRRDYDEIAADTGGRVTDLILSASQLSLEGFTEFRYEDAR